MRRARYLIHDRDPLSTRGFGEILEGGGVQPIRLPPKSPNLNAYAERFVRSMIMRSVSVVLPPSTVTQAAASSSPPGAVGNRPCTAHAIAPMRINTNLRMAADRCFRHQVLVKRA